MTRIEVNPGPCGLVTVIRARSDDEGRVHLEIESGCPAVQRLAEGLEAIDPCTEGGTIFRSSVYRAADTCLKHTDCIAPAAILRAVNVEVGLALPREAWIRVVKGQMG